MEETNTEREKWRRKNGNKGFKKERENEIK
jgi:hypothetical protein